MRSNGRRRRGQRHPLFTTTAGQILWQLCGGRLTVADLAKSLSLTKNAIRAQLDRLQRSKLVAQVGTREGVRRPHAEYQLTGNARRLFPTAYEPVLRHLADVMAERLPGPTARELLTEAVRRVIGDELNVSQYDPDQRLAEVVRRLTARGAAVQLALEPHRLVLSSCSCPLASVTAAHEDVCGAVAGLLGEVIGSPVRQTCIAGELRQCQFEVERAVPAGPVSEERRPRP